MDDIISKIRKGRVCVVRDMTQAEQNLVLLEKLFPVNEKFYVWCYAPDGRCVATSCPEEEKPLLDQSFRILGGFGISKSKKMNGKGKGMSIAAIIIASVDFVLTLALTLAIYFAYIVYLVK